jgi:hypothetical protein
MRELSRQVPPFAGIGGSAPSASPGHAQTAVDDARLRAEEPGRSASWPAVAASLLLLGACQLPGGENLALDQGGEAPEAAIYTEGFHAHAGSKVTLLYISALDCPPCVRWATTAIGNGWISERQFTALPDAAQIEMRTITARSYHRTDLATDWPDDLRWVASTTFVAAGAPRYVLLVDGVVVANVHGLRGFTNEIVPAIQRLVREKTA